MRIVVLIVGLLGAVTTGFLGYRWWDDVRQNGSTLEAMRPLIQAAADPETKAKLTEYDERSKTYPFLFAGAVLGLAGAIAGYVGKGLIAAGLMLLGVILPAIFHPGTLIFTSPLILAGILAFFVKAPRPVSTYSHAAA